MRIDNDQSQYSIASLIIGSVSLFLWLIPIVSVFTALISVYSGIKGYNSQRGGLSKVGILFGVISFILTLLRSGFVNGMF